MTLLDFREKVLKLKGLVTDPEDRAALEEAIKTTAIYRTVGDRDAKTLDTLLEKYVETP
jgi:hypothetical protein